MLGRWYLDWTRVLPNEVAGWRRIVFSRLKSPPATASGTATPRGVTVTLMR
jgi:hypothetical protein